MPAADRDRIAELIKQNNYMAVTTADVDILCNDFNACIAISPPPLLLFHADGKAHQSRKINVAIIKEYIRVLCAVFEHGTAELRLYFFNNYLSVLMQVINFNPQAAKPFVLHTSDEVFALIAAAQGFLAKLMTQELEPDYKLNIFSIIKRLFEDIIMRRLILIKEASKPACTQGLLHFVKIIRDLSRIGKIKDFEVSTRSLFETLVKNSDLTQADSSEGSIAHILADVKADEGVYHLLADILPKIKTLTADASGRTVLQCMNVATFKSYFSLHHAEISQDEILAVLHDAIARQDTDKLEFLLNQVNLKKLSATELEKILDIFITASVSKHQDAIEIALTELGNIPNWDNYKLVVNGKSLWEKLESTQVIIALQVFPIEHSVMLKMWMDVQFQLRSREDFDHISVEALSESTATIAKYLSEVIVREYRDVARSGHAELACALNFIAQYGVFSGVDQITIFDSDVAVAQTPDFKSRLLQWCCDPLAGNKVSAIEFAANNFKGNMLVAILKYKYDQGIVVAADFRTKFEKAFTLLLRTPAPESGDKQRKANAINSLLQYLNTFWFAGDEVALCKALKQQLEFVLKADPEFANLIKIKEFGIKVPDRAVANSERRRSSAFLAVG